MLYLPTGTYYMYGPCSMRRSDRSMVNMSAVNQFLIDIQTIENGNNQQLYAAYRDKLFTLLQYICRAHQGDRLNPLTRQQELENECMNTVCIAIKHAFTVLCNRW